MQPTTVDGPVKSGALLEIIEIIQSEVPLAQRRALVGERLLELLDAQTFVSYVYDTDGSFVDPIDINLGASSLAAYDAHFRHVDQITPALFNRLGASAISPSRHSTNEFIHDFLQARRMDHGMNFFARSPSRGKIDLRIWRDNAAGAFTPADVRLLEGVGGLTERLWTVTSGGAETAVVPALTSRELEVAALVAEGLSDRHILTRLGMAMPTLRTHLRNSFAKIGVQSRAGLAAHYVRHHQ